MSGRLKKASTLAKGIGNDMENLYMRHGLIVSVMSLFLVSLSSNAQPIKSFSDGNWTAKYPSTWTYSNQKNADGSLIHMFMGPQRSKSVSYCHVTQQGLSPSLNPRVSKMSKSQIRDLLLSSDKEMFSLMYTTVVAAPNFNLLRVGPTVIGKETPSMSADFSFSNPQGFFYRVHSNYTLWNKGQLSVWCQGSGRSYKDAEDGYFLSIEDFQRFIANLELRIQ